MATIEITTHVNAELMQEIWNDQRHLADDAPEMSLEEAENFLASEEDDLGRELFARCEEYLAYCARSKIRDE